MENKDLFEFAPNENLKALLRRIDSDPELAAKLSEVRDPDEAYRIVSEVQQGFTKEEFVDTMSKIYEAVTQDLSEDDLANVAGGDIAGATVAISINVASLAAVSAICTGI